MVKQDTLIKRQTTFIIERDGKRKRKRNRIRDLEVCGNSLPDNSMRSPSKVVGRLFF